jgi:RNA polymerase sigma-70 factor (ECF subfamily)
MNAAQSISLSVPPAAAESRIADGAAVTAFRRLLDRVWPEQVARLAALSAALGLPREQVADVLQDVYLTALAHPPALEAGEELVRWLFRVAANRSKLEHRRHSRWQRLWQSLTGVWRGEAPAATYGELKAEVERGLATLEDEDRLLVALRYFSELNSREIAEIVGIPESTVRGRLRTARRKLAIELADWNDE